MKNQQNQSGDSFQGSLSKCEELSNRLYKTNLKLARLNTEKEALYESSEFDTVKLGELNKEYEHVTGEITLIKNDQRKLNCFGVEGSPNSYDTQSILSTSSVTKKEPALLVQMPKK